MSARPGPGSASHLAVTGHHSNGGIDGGRGQLRQGERAVDGPGRGRCRDPAGRAHRRGARTRGLRRRARRHRADRRCTSGWTVPAFRCAPPKSKVAAASNPTVRPRPARSSWSPCGRPKGATNRAGPSATPGSVSYNAAVESAASRDTDPQPAAFAQRVHREAQRRGFDTAARRVVVGDGAPWIWNLSAEQFPAPSKSSTSTIAKQHLCDVAKAIYGAGTDLAEQWAKDRHGELDAGRLGALVTALRTQTETTPEARKCIHYVFGNRPPDALSAVPREGPVHFFGRRRGRMQADRRTAQARRYALDHRWRQRHHRPALLPAQRPLRGLLGAASRKRRLKRHLTNLSCTPGVGRCTASCGAAAGGCATPHVGSSRASAAPPLRSGPAGDPTSGVAGWLDMAESRASGHDLTGARRVGSAAVAE